jgi:hypothetical protein
MSPMFDDFSALVDFQWTSGCFLRIGKDFINGKNSHQKSFIRSYHSFRSLISSVISCMLALGVNISNYFVLGKTSALTYQVGCVRCNNNFEVHLLRSRHVFVCL